MDVDSDLTISVINVYFNDKGIRTGENRSFWATICLFFDDNRTDFYNIHFNIKTNLIFRFNLNIAISKLFRSIFTLLHRFCFNVYFYFFNLFVVVKARKMNQKIENRKQKNIVNTLYQKRHWKLDNTIFSDFFRFSFVQNIDVNSAVWVGFGIFKDTIYVLRVLSNREVFVSLWGSLFRSTANINVQTILRSTEIFSKNELTLDLKRYEDISKRLWKNF